MTYPSDLNPAGRDRRDPDPWLALYLDQSTPLDDDAKADLMRGMRRPSRKYLLPPTRVAAGAMIVLFTVLRAVLPGRASASLTLHRLITWGLRTFAAPEANRLILRHFHIGTELLNFIKDNVPDADIVTIPLQPVTLEDLKDEVFLKHDLNIFNFVIDLNRHLRETGTDLTPKALSDLNFESITDGPFPLAEMPAGSMNMIDLQTAVTAYTPIYQLFLSTRDFWRAANSLQLDETIAIYVGKLLGTADHLALARNAHPTLPLSTMDAGFRLMLHGLAAEQLHGFLRMKKREQAGLSGQPN